MQFEGTAKKVSFEGSHHRISSAEFRVRTVCKQIVSFESIAGEVSFEKSHHRISSENLELEL